MSIQLYNLPYHAASTAEKWMGSVAALVVCISRRTGIMIVDIAAASPRSKRSKFFVVLAKICINIWKFKFIANQPVI